MNLIPPTAYQGGKQRISKEIIEIIQPNGVFYDLCCGSGAISIELINQGYTPSSIHMLDIGPWGLFWKTIGEGNFCLNRFKYWIDQVPKKKDKIQSFMQDLSKTDEDATYIFLLLQCSSFGSKAIWTKGWKWQNCSFRNYWMPTATSSRRLPVNPMMPMPETLYERVCSIVDAMKGINGYCCDINEIKIPEDATVYVDPPYLNTTFYKDSFDVINFVKSLKCKRIFVSEGKQLSDTAYLISSGRKKGGISGDRKTINEEWLSKYEST